MALPQPIVTEIQELAKYLRWRASEDKTRAACCRAMDKSDFLPGGRGLPTT